MTDTPSPSSSDSSGSPGSADSPDEVQLPEPNETEVDEAVMDESAENPALDVGQVTTPVDEENEDGDPRQS